MKTIKKLRFPLLVIILMLGALSASGQNQGQRQGQGQGQGQGQRQGQGRNFTEDDVKQRVDRLSESLEMTDEQEAAILKFELDAYKKNQVERQKLMDAGDREAMRSYMQEQKKVRDVKYAEILTEEQMKEYAKILEERQQQMRDRNKERNPEQDGERSERGRGRG